MAKPYRPSNGTDGEIFYANWCEGCAKDAKYRETGKGGCQIIVGAMLYDIGDPDYPPEWIQDEHGPRCTAFVPVEG